jgi:hypothetical protein
MTDAGTIRPVRMRFARSDRKAIWLLRGRCACVALALVATIYALNSGPQRRTVGTR